MRINSFVKSCFFIVGLLSGGISALAENVAGGVTGGGGDVRTAGFASSAEVAAVIAESKAQVLLASHLMGHFALAYQFIPEEIHDLYVKPHAFEEALSQLTIQVKISSPCYGDDGAPHDGWFSAHTPQQICLSASEISKSVLRDQVKTQVIALILHEVSHSFGFTEEQAVRYQDLVLKYAPTVTEALPSITQVENYFSSNLVPSSQLMLSEDAKLRCQGARSLFDGLGSLTEKIFIEKSGIVLSAQGSHQYVDLQNRLFVYISNNCRSGFPQQRFDEKKYVDAVKILQLDAAAVLKNASQKFKTIIE